MWAWRIQAFHITGVVLLKLSEKLRCTKRAICRETKCFSVHFWFFKYLLLNNERTSLTWGLLSCSAVPFTRREDGAIKQNQAVCCINVYLPSSSPSERARPTGRAAGTPLPRLLSPGMMWISATVLTAPGQGFLWLTFPISPLLSSPLLFPGFSLLVCIWPATQPAPNLALQQLCWPQGWACPKTFLSQSYQTQFPLIWLPHNPSGGNSSAAGCELQQQINVRDRAALLEMRNLTPWAGAGMGRWQGEPQPCPGLFQDQRCVPRADCGVSHAWHGVLRMRWARNTAALKQSGI